MFATRRTMMRHSPRALSLVRTLSSAPRRIRSTLLGASANQTKLSNFDSALPAASARAFSTNLSAAQSSDNPPFGTVIIYNQSKHASGSVLADIRAVWGNRVRVLQVIEGGLQPLPGTDGCIFLADSKCWGDMKHFEDRLNSACATDHALSAARTRGDVAFMPGWSAFAESAEAAVAVQELGLVWPGTEPVASGKLEKIGFKQICEKVGAPTPPFCVLSEEGPSRQLNDPAEREAVVQEYMAAIAGMQTERPGLIKSIHGGGGKGTAHLNNPSDAIESRAAIEKVLTEMNRSDGIYFEQKVNSTGDGRFFQLELEVDGDQVANGGRFVWFNSRLQKVVEIGLSDDLIDLFMPQDLYMKAREWSAQVAREANNNTRATMEALVFEETPGKHEIMFIECNRRPQVENEALSLLQVDSDGNRRYTFAELLMRAAGNKHPTFTAAAEDTKVVLHARILHGNPDNEGTIAYQPGNVLGMSGPRLDFVKSELLAPGEISFSSDPQLGKAVITAASWEEMCDRAVEYFKLRRPNINGPSSTYGQVMQNLFGSEKFRKGKIASNETFSAVHIPEFPGPTVTTVLRDQVAPVLVKGYRPGEGVDPQRWPTETVATALEGIVGNLQREIPNETVFTKYARGDASVDDYFTALRGDLAKRGGAWVTVAPRDTAQQGNDSESAAVAAISRRNAEVWAQRAGCVGYETGGAQYQAGLIRGQDPAAILRLGLPYNMPAHSLQRSQYVNGLAELPAEVRTSLFRATAGLVSGHYHRTGAAVEAQVPWFPYNFHAGNFHDAKTGFSAQDETTGELLAAGCTPMPNWVFSPKFSLEALGQWTNRQIDVFERHGRVLHQVRIKNPGQGVDWTAENIWAHVEMIRGVFRERGLLEPIINMHNHDFNGLGGHVGKQMFELGAKHGFPNLVIDGAYRKNGTHNDNTVMLSALNFSAEEKEALEEYNHLQQSIEGILARFDSRTSQMTPWDSDWAGGTEGSDLRIAKEYGIPARSINHAKEVASEVFPLERAVTPFSEYKLRIGIAIMIEPGIEPKSADAVRAFVENGGKLALGGDVLVGLKRWETLVAKPPIVNKLLDNMSSELGEALQATTNVISDADLSPMLSDADRHTALGYQAKGVEFLKLKAEGKHVSALLLAPQVLHRKPLTLPMGSRFSILHNGVREKIEFTGFGRAPNTDITLNFKHNGMDLQIAVDDPNAVAGAGAASGPRKAIPENKNEYGTTVPGELLKYEVAVGDVLKEGEPFCILESMKMEVKLSVPAQLDGMKVKLLPLTGRTKTDQGTILQPGHLLVECEPAE